MSYRSEVVMFGQSNLGWCEGYMVQVAQTGSNEPPCSAAWVQYYKYYNHRNTTCNIVWVQTNKYNIPRNQLGANDMDCGEDYMIWAGQTDGNGLLD